jgi:hypothetical protein
LNVWMVTMQCACRVLAIWAQWPVALHCYESVHSLVAQ